VTGWGGWLRRPAFVQAACGAARAEGHGLEVDALVGEQFGQAHHDGVADGGAVLHLDGVDRADHRRAVERGCLRHLGRAGEGDQPHLDVARHRVRKALAASWAATMRVGLTSCTRMLREMSIASRMVDLAQGSVTGRRRARQCQQQQRQGHEHQRRVARAGASAGLRPRARRSGLDSFSAGLPARRSSHRYSSGNSGSTSIHHRLSRPQEGHRFQRGHAHGPRASILTVRRPSWARAPGKGWAETGLRAREWPPCPKPPGCCSSSPRSW
jgi:hypothetical protein